MILGFELVNATTGESHGKYYTLDEALGAAAYDRLAAFTVWRGDVIVWEQEHD